jgi:hypothetical protein
MTIEQLKEMHQARPFRPFRIHLADGQHLDVLHPEFLSQSKSGRTISVAAEDGDYLKVVDLLLVTMLEPINGKAEGRRRRT